jgi:hypothetical protein
MAQTGSIAILPPGERLHMTEEQKQAERDARALEQHTMAYAVVETARVRDAAILERVKAYLADRPPDDGSARGRLSGHLERIKLAREQAGVAAARAAECGEAATGLATAKAALETVQAEIAVDYAEWTRFGSSSPGIRPATRPDELNSLRAEIDRLTPAAGASATADFESSVAQAAVAALETLLPRRRADVVAEEQAPSIISRLRAAAAELEKCCNELCALDEVTGEADAGLSALGIDARRRFMPAGASRTKVSVPGLMPGGPIGFMIEPDRAALERFRDALAAHPLAEPQPKPTLLARLAKNRRP